MTVVQIVKTDADISKCRSAIQALRPSLSDDIYNEAVQKTLADNRQIVFIEDNNEAAAIAVFETGYNLFRGKYIY
ncbi:MAG: GNAT family N-acetyltransferase, partial [Dyadobacter sp.]